MNDLGTQVTKEVERNVDGCCEYLLPRYRTLSTLLSPTDGLSVTIPAVLSVTSSSATERIHKVAIQMMENVRSAWKGGPSAPSSTTSATDQCSANATTVHTSSGSSRCYRSRILRTHVQLRQEVKQEKPLLSWRLAA